MLYEAFTSIMLLKATSILCWLKILSLVTHLNHFKPLYKAPENVTQLMQIRTDILSVFEIFVNNAPGGDDACTQTVNSPALVRKTNSRVCMID